MTADGDSTGEPAPTSSAPRRKRRFRWIKWLLGVALAALLVGEGAYLWPRLHESWQSLTEIHWGWFALAIWLQALSMSGFGRVQKQLLHAGGVDVTQRKSVAVVYGATAMSVTLPARARSSPPRSPIGRPGAGARARSWRPGSW